MGFAGATRVDGWLMSTTQGTGSAGQGSPAPVPERSRSRGGFLGWLLVREDLSRARENAARFTTQQREYLRRAKLAFELAELSLGPGNAVRSGSPAPLAANLFRQSLYWALLSHSPEQGLKSSEALWAAADSAALASLAANDDELARIATAMRSSFIELAEESLETQRATADLLQRSATRLIKHTQLVLWQLEWFKLKRLVRVVSLAVFCAVPLAFGLNLLSIKPDLAKGKPWHVSSVGLEEHPISHEVGAESLVRVRLCCAARLLFAHDPQSQRLLRRASVPADRRGQQ
jgi:hypothetical protein